MIRGVSLPLEAAVVVLRLLVHGRVQGVGYRAWAQDRAIELGLDGFVRNRRDGSVEILADGPAAGLEEFIGACRRGPRLASVTQVEVGEAGEEVSRGFHQLPTA